MIHLLFSKYPIKQLKSENENVIKNHCDEYPINVSPEDFVRRLNEGYILFPGGSAVHPLYDSSYLGVMFFDFDMSEKDSFDKKTLLSILFTANLTPSLICDTSNKNYFRIAYILENNIDGRSDITEAFQYMFSILSSLKVDINNSHARGYINDCRNIKRLTDKSFDIYRIKRFRDDYATKVKSLCDALRSGIVVPMRKGYNNALNVLNNASISNNKAYLKYDGCMQNIDLMWLKVLFSMHCRGMSVANKKDAQNIYSLPLSQIGRYANRNIYSNQGKSLKSAFNVYNKLIAVKEYNTEIPVLNNYTENGMLYYDGTYFDYLKKDLYIYQGKNIGLKKSENYFVINKDAFKGNMYGEMIAERLIMLILSFRNSFERTYICSDIIDSLPIFKDKIDSLSTAKEKNIYLKRAFETAIKIVNNGWYSPCVSYNWRVTCEIPTSNHLDKPITFKYISYLFLL